MKFNFEDFYDRLLNRTDYLDDLWDTFPEGRTLQFKEKTLNLLMHNILERDHLRLACTLAVIYHDGADKDYTALLISLLDQKWHQLEEDIVGVLEIIKDPVSVKKLSDLIDDVPVYDEMRALAKKCMWALSAIRTKEAIDKLISLTMSNDQIIKENAKFQLDNINNWN